MGCGVVLRAASSASSVGRPESSALSTTSGRPRARFTAFYVLLGGILGVCSLTCGLSAMWCAGDASDVDRERLEGAQTGVREGQPYRPFRVLAALLRSYSGVYGSLVYAERAYASRTAGRCKNPDYNPPYPTLGTQCARPCTESPMCTVILRGYGTKAVERRTKPCHKRVPKCASCDANIFID